MKHLVFVWLVLTPIYSLCQGENEKLHSTPESNKHTGLKIEYFPREKIILPVCKEREDSNECLRAHIESKVLDFLNAKVRRPKSKKDTLEIDIVFSVDKEGRVVKKPHERLVNAFFLKEKQTEVLSDIILDLPRFELKNRKPEIYNVRHSFGFEMIYNKNEKSPFKILKREKYDGGKVVEVPLFPGCERQSDKLEKECFQRKMQEHIAYHFNYPAEALANRISGRVDVMMTIGKDGKVRDIKTRGPHYLLIQEAERIMNLLPAMEPAKIDGKPTDVPYSIPVSFAIN